MGQKNVLWPFQASTDSGEGKGIWEVGVLGQEGREVELGSDSYV